MYLKNIGSRICADMDMTEWQKMHFLWIYFTTANARELMPPMHHFDGSCQFILHHTLFSWSEAKYFLWNVFLLLLFFFLFLCHWWGLSCWKVFMRYLRCHIFNIKMPSCLVLLKGRRMNAKLIFFAFSSLFIFTEILNRNSLSTKPYRNYCIAQTRKSIVKVNLIWK